MHWNLFSDENKYYIQAYTKAQCRYWKFVAWINIVILIKIAAWNNTLAVVTLQAFTSGKSFYLGKISLGMFTSGFIFPKLKGHTGDHWTLGGLTSQRIKFQLAIACLKFWRKNGKHARESNGSKRGFYSYFIAVHYFLSKSKTSKSNFTVAPDFSKVSKTTRAAFSQFLTIFAWRQQQRPKRVAWVLPRPQYWFETLFHSNALNMWWKE